MNCPRCGHGREHHSNLAGCIVCKPGDCLTRPRDIPAEDPGATAAAVEAVHVTTDPAWGKAAADAVDALAATGVPFSTDDVWYRLAAAGIEPPAEPRAIGPVMQAAAREGRIVRDGATTSRRRHQSLIRTYVGTGA